MLRRNKGLRVRAADDQAHRIRLTVSKTIDPERGREELRTHQNVYWDSRTFLGLNCRSLTRRSSLDRVRLLDTTFMQPSMLVEAEAMQVKVVAPVWDVRSPSTLP